MTYGLIRQKWIQMGSEESAVGFPESDELPGDYGGRVNLFEHGAILYHPSIGTFVTFGAIFRHWRSLGGVSGLGYPLTDELAAANAGGTPGRYNHFERGSIYYTDQKGAVEVPTDIKSAWADNGWEKGPLGFPINRPAKMPGVFTNFQDFEGGTIYAFGPNSKTIVRNRRSLYFSTENFIDWADFGGALPDGDIIVATFSQNFPQFGIRVTLNAGPGVTWWKALSLFTVGRGDFQEIWTQDNTTSATTLIDPSIFDNEDVYLHFKKAKGLGAHWGIYLLGRADRLIGTHVTFTWIRD